MVHNGIEYGLMAAYAEGLNVLAKADIGTETHAADAETAPLSGPEYYQYDFDLAAITEVWRRGSVVASWLLDLTAQALAARSPPRRLRRAGQRQRRGALDDQRGHRRGRAGARCCRRRCSQRFSSRGRADVADKVLSAMRAGFGGHVERKESSR